MFKLFAVATYALATLSAVSGVAIVRDSKPSTYNENVLESYADYHGRYMALSCNAKHNTQFFDECCHPMLKGETLANNREAHCNPTASASVVSSAAQPTPTDDDDDDCDDEDDETTVAPTPTPSPSPAAPSSSPVKATPTPVVNPAPQPPKVSSTKTPQPQATPAAPSKSNGQEYKGDATYFYQNGVAGACGTVHSDSDFIVALDYRTYGNTSQKSQYCGKSVVISDGKNSITAKVADACPSCSGPGSLDLSEGAFKALQPLSVGLFDITWHFA